MKCKRCGSMEGVKQYSIVIQPSDGMYAGDPKSLFGLGGVAYWCPACAKFITKDVSKYVGLEEGMRQEAKDGRTSQ